MTANHLPLTGVCIVKDACPFGYSMISECFNDQSADANLWRETSSHQSSRRLTVATRKRFLCYSRSNSQANEVSDVLVSLRIDANTAPPPSGFTTLSLTQDTGESSLNEQLLSIKLVPKGLAENFITDIVVVAITKKAPPGYYAVGELNDRLICCQSGNAQKQTVASPFLFRTQSKRFSRSFRSATSLFRLHGVSKPSQRIRFVLWYRHTGDPEIVTIPVHIPASLCKSFQDESEITKDAGDHDITYMAIKNGNIPFMYLVAPKLIQLKVPNIVNSSQLERLQSLMHLKTLDLSNNDFSSGLPIVISELISLRDLCLSNCELNAFPKSLAKTTLLETLDLSDNKLLSISSHVHQLSTLKLLNLSANVDLVWIDDHIMQLKNLAKLECNGCESLETPPYAVCQQGLHAVRQYFTDLAKHHARLLTSAPLVVIGQALAGKTSIVRSLQAGKRQLTYRSDSSPLDEGTKVFQVEELHLQNHALNVIDYGGHEPYLHTYSLLIGEQCMPLIVVNIEEYFHLSESKGPKEAARRVLFDWISQAYLVSPHLGPPLLALTHLDRYTVEQCKFSKRALLENTELLRSEMLEEESNYVADFPNQLNHILHLSNQSIPIFSPEDIFEFNNSLHETDNIENLKDNLNRRCEKLICVVPQMWNAVHSFMELQCDRPFIALADIISEFSNDDVSFILRWLRNTGRILWFEEIPALAELVFHDLTAITELIATIFHHCSNELWEQRLETFTCFRHKQSVISKPQYEMLVEQFRRTGLMEEALLFNLLKTHSKFPTHVAIELLKGLYILYGPIDQSRISSYVIPAFSSNFMDSAWMTDGYLQLRLDLRFSGFSPPKHLYQIATVEFLNTSCNQLSTIMATRNGATIYDGEITKHLVHDYNNSKMTLQVSSTVEKLAPSWNRLQAMVRVIRNLIGRLWKGCYTVVQMYCSHCLFMRESDPDFYIDPEWLNDDLGSPKEFSNVQFISCKHSGRQKATNSSATVPKALRWPCSKIDDAEIEKLRNYLSSLEHQRCSPSFGEVREIAYIAPSVIIPQRKRGMNPETKDDLVIRHMIQSEKTSAVIDSARTNKQKEQFAEFKADVEKQYPGCEALNELTIKCGRCGLNKRLNRMRYHPHFGKNAKAHYLICTTTQRQAQATKRPGHQDIREMFAKARRVHDDDSVITLDDSIQWNNDTSSGEWDVDTFGSSDIGPLHQNTSSSSPEQHAAEVEVCIDEFDNEDPEFDETYLGWPHDRIIYMEELDPLALMIQKEVESKNGFDKEHIFYKLIYSALESAHARPGLFEWPEDIIDFVNTVESLGSVKTCNFIRGPGSIKSVEDKPFWKSVNIPIPSKSTRQRHKPSPVKDSGVLTHNVKNFHRIVAEYCKPLISNDLVSIVPVCASRDAMAIKPSGDFDASSNTLVGLTFPITLDFVEKNPEPDPELIKSGLYTEAGAIIVTTLDNEYGLLVANDFLTHRTSGDDVYNKICNAIHCLQCCEECLQEVRSPIITPSDISCDSKCAQCLHNIRAGLEETCDECTTDGIDSPYPQLRPCKRCTTKNTICRKLAVIALTMDCEANNAAAMRKLDHEPSLPDDMLLFNIIPDAVHAGKKAFRASANWWLFLDGYRINNSIIRSLRIFDKEVKDALKYVVPDSSLRNRDRMDFGAILEATSPEVCSVLTEMSTKHGPEVTCTLFPDPFWKSKNRSTIKSADDICIAQGSVLVLDRIQGSVQKIKLHYPPEVDCIIKVKEPRCLTFHNGYIYIGTSSGIRVCNASGKWKKAPSKQSMLDAAKESEGHNPVLDSLTRTQLAEVVGSQAGNSVPYLSLEHKLIPDALHSHRDSLYIYDAGSSGIWKVDVSLIGTIPKGTPHLIFSLNKAVSSISVYESTIYVASPAVDGGLFSYDVDNETLGHLIHNGKDTTVSAVCSNQHQTVYSDASKGQICLLQPGGTSRVLSGLEQTGMASLSATDGFSKNCTHAQPTCMCVEEKTIFVIDQASTSVRLITDITTLLKYHSTIDGLYEAFSVHSDNVGYRAIMTEDQLNEKLEDICAIYQNMLKGVQMLHKNNQLKPNGPHGSLPYGTMMMFNQMKRNTTDLVAFVTSTNRNYTVHPVALLSIPCEHHFSNMRSRYQMPTLLQYSEHLCSVIDETIKRATVSAYHYYTHKKLLLSQTYPQHQAQVKICKWTHCVTASF